MYIMVVSLWLVLGDFVPFLFTALKPPLLPPNFNIMEKMAYFLGEHVDHRELDT